MVGKVGVEPTRCCHHTLLRRARMPIPPLAQPFDLKPILLYTVFHDSSRNL